MKLYLISVLLVIIIFNVTEVELMECYVCNLQEGNNDKCIKTSMQCLEHEDFCLSEITYETPPYWLNIMERRHFVQKRCISKDECARIKDQYASKCYREYYMDWKCAECCEGEMCNYYVTLSGRRTHHHWLLLACLTLVTTGAIIIQ